jgi:hypothetical protein
VNTQTNIQTTVTELSKRIFQCPGTTCLKLKVAPLSQDVNVLNKHGSNVRDNLLSLVHSSSLIAVQLERLEDTWAMCRSVLAMEARKYQWRTEEFYSLCPAGSGYAEHVGQRHVDPHVSS